MPSGTYTFYAQLDGYSDVAGQNVEAGTLIGYNGSTGNAGSAKHVHFEYHPGGERLWIPTRCSSPSAETAEILVRSREGRHDADPFGSDDAPRGRRLSSTLGDSSAAGSRPAAKLVRPVQHCAPGSARGSASSGRRMPPVIPSLGGSKRSLRPASPP